MPERALSAAAVGPAASRALLLEPVTARTTEIPVGAALEHVGQGRLVVLPCALQSLGLLDGLRDAVLEEIGRASSTATAAAVAAAGIEQLHRHLGPAEMLAALDALLARLTPTAPRLVRALVRELLGHRGPVYVGDKLWVRFFVPHDVYHESRALYARRPGHLQIIGPHRDSWFTVPENAIAMWIAMGRVRRGNSMLVYERLWGRPVPRERPTVPSPQPFGPPTVVELDAGDVLLFSGGHLHASELNVTDETRHVLTARFTIGTPRYGEGRLWKAYRNLTLLDTPLAPLAGVRSALTAAAARRYGATLRAVARRRVLGRDRLEV